jgi:hypothetical protein
VSRGCASRRGVSGVTRVRGARDVRGAYIYTCIRGVTDVRRAAAGGLLEHSNLSG